MGVAYAIVIREFITNLLACMDSWTRAADGKIPMDVLCFEFYKAFDRVLRLVYKLDRFGIRGCLYAWIESFLSERTLTMRIADKQSFKRPVPQRCPPRKYFGVYSIPVVHLGPTCFPEIQPCLPH